MKLAFKQTDLINHNQWMIFKGGLIQILLFVLMLLMMLRCTNREQPSAPVNTAPLSDTVTKDAVQLEKGAIDNSYIPIASFHSEEVRNKLRDLEKLKFEQGTLPYQLLDYLKMGENDLGYEFKFIEMRFDKKDAVVNERFIGEIAGLATILQHFPNMRIRLMSYTDSVGEDAANEKLTLNRAIEVRKRLVAAGVAENRIEVKGLGEKYPVGDNKTYDGQLINNRIEMIILSK
jgi:outer membrane protein OmpA-like peptidoglycan-associated protein